MALTIVREKLLTTIADVSLLYVILNIYWHYVSAEQVGNDADDEVASSLCHSNRFVCYRDCCLKGDWFCHHERQKCYPCASRAFLCGNESLPLECLLYCYKLAQSSTDSDHDSVCVTWSTFVAAVATMGTVVVCLIFTLAALCVCARRTPLNRWPLCLRALLGLHIQQRIFGGRDGDEEKDPNATTGEKDPMLEMTNRTTEDVNAINLQNDPTALPQSPPPPPASSLSSLSSSSPSHPPSSITDDSSNSSANMEDLNLTRVKTEDTDDDTQQTRGRPVHDGASAPATTQPEVSHRPRPAMTAEGSSGGRTQPLPQEQELGLGAEDGTTAAGTPVAVSEDGRGMSRHQGRIAIYQSPDPSTDFETESAGFPRGAAAHDGHVHLESSYHPGVNGTSPQPQYPQRDAGYTVNEIIHKPDFSMMNPTNTVDDNGCHIIATGTANPLSNYQLLSMPR